MMTVSNDRSDRPDLYNRSDRWHHGPVTTLIRRVQGDEFDDAVERRAEKLLTEQQREQLAAYCAYLEAIRYKTGEHADHTQRIVGHWLICSCGGRAVVAANFSPR